MSCCCWSWSRGLNSKQQEQEESCGGRKPRVKHGNSGWPFWTCHEFTGSEAISSWSGECRERDGLIVSGEERKDGKREDRTRWIREWNCYTGAPCSKGTRVRGTRGKGDLERGGGYHGYQKPQPMSTIREVSLTSGLR
ncbi:hypothetical protein KQX54_009823 [Cotesia glomerata]|uniref:Uncharacterized protein n=1 Tax=Cotesia glomerata TaxID=32391 RepID=A0AAV7J2C2_COTGL|nr:hypothetical protein KQX54_009823 [Cotesia glomerata]